MSSAIGGGGAAGGTVHRGNATRGGNVMTAVGGKGREHGNGKASRETHGVGGCGVSERGGLNGGSEVRKLTGYPW